MSPFGIVASIIGGVVAVVLVMYWLLVQAVTCRWPFNDGGPVDKMMGG